MKIYIDTLGCPKNVNDSEITAGLLEQAGHTILSAPDGADAVMVNTCAFIEDAKRESIDRIFELAAEDRLLIVTGCLTERYREELFQALPEADILLGVNDYSRLPEILSEYAGNRERHFSPCPQVYEELGTAKRDNVKSACIKIAEGCSNRCAYCVIPSIRGPYRSRKKEAILQEASDLAARGCKEVVLIAQDVTAWGIDLYGHYALSELLRALCSIDGIRWIRLLYCYEDRITDELIQTMAEEEKICHYIDIPIQHIADPVLKAMNRRSTGAGIRKTLAKLREAIPDIHIRTTLITGFPGETKADFEELLAFVKEARFERLGVFAFSREEGTPAYSMENQVRRDVRERRRDACMRAQMEIALAKNTEKIGTVMEVFVERYDESGTEDTSSGNVTYIGRTRYDAPEIDNAVIFTAPMTGLQNGDIVNVQITDAFDYDLTGVLITK